jgi:tetratricopeptide (TPR) repeat protein
VHYLRHAGLKSTERSALPEAVTWFEQARAVLSTLPETRSSMEQAFNICLEERAAQMHLGHGRMILDRLREAGTLADRFNDDRRRAQVYVFMTNTHSMLGESDEALATGSQALGFARVLEDLEIRNVATSYLIQARYLRGQYDGAIKLATDNLGALSADSTYEHSGTGALIPLHYRCWAVSSLAQLGTFAAAVKYAAEALRLAELTNHALTIGLAHHAGSALHLLRGEWGKARALTERWVELSRSGSPYLQLGYALSTRAWVLAQVGQAEEATESLCEGEQTLQASAEDGIVLHHGWGYESLGRASLLLGHRDEARRFGEQAIKCSPKYFGYAAHAFHLLGDVATHRDQFDADTGEAHYRQALALAEPRGMRPLVAHCHLGLGKLHCRNGDREQAEEHLTTAMAMYREMGMIYWPKQSEAELCQLG